MSREWDELKQEVRFGWRALFWPLGAMWGIEIFNLLLGGRLNAFGIAPRSAEGLAGILFAPLLHGSISHIVNNSIGWIVAGTLLALSEARRFLAVMVIGALTSGLGVWLAGETETVHIGASGVVFAFFGYVLARGWATRNLLRIATSLAFGSVFGASLLTGLVPQSGISWEGHFFGLLGGVLSAFVLRAATPDQIDPLTLRQSHLVPMPESKTR
jgi:membrane associated rhomboid family serine protease